MDIGSLVERYPVAALALAGGAGYLLYTRFFKSNPNATASPQTVDTQQVGNAWVSSEMLQNALEAQREAIQADIQREVQDRRWATQYAQAG